MTSDRHDDTTPRIPFGDEETDEPFYISPGGKTCPDCGVDRGELHTPGCDQEQCPICGMQLIGCGHAEEVLP